MRTSRKFPVLATMLTVILASASLQAGTVQIFSDSAPADHPALLGVSKFAELVRERSEGRLSIEIFANSRLLDSRSSLTATQLGGIAYCRANPEELTDIVPALGVLAVPYLFRNETQRWRILNGPIGQELLAALEDCGLVGLTYYDAGARNFYFSRHVVANPDDMRGMRIEIPVSYTMLSLVHALGAIPVTLGTDAATAAFRDRRLDGAEGDWHSYLREGRYEVAPYFTLDEHLRVPDILCISKLIWDGLPPEDQRLIRQAAIESQITQRQAWREYEDKSIQAVTASGQVTVTEPANLLLWMQEAKSMYPRLRLGERGAELLHRIEAMP